MRRRSKDLSPRNQGSTSKRELGCCGECQHRLPSALIIGRGSSTSRRNDILRKDCDGSPLISAKESGYNLHGRITHTKGPAGLRAAGNTLRRTSRMVITSSRSPFRVVSIRAVIICLPRARAIDRIVPN